MAWRNSIFGKWRRYSLFSITRSQPQRSTCKDLGCSCNGQERAITPRAAYVLAYAHNALPGRRSLRVRTLSAMAKARPSRLRPLMFWLTPITRSPAQGPACKDLGRNGQDRAITTKAAYTPVPERAGSRSLKKSPQPSLPTLH